jgi:phage/plasmid-associated DNA primase
MNLPVEEYRLVCEKRRSVFEQLPDDYPIKLYADFDYKYHKHAGEDADFYNCTDELISIGKRAIEKQIHQLGGKNAPIFCVKVATSESDRIISFHIIVSNYCMMKRQQHEFVKSMNADLQTDMTDNWSRDYLSVNKEREASGFFDSAIYDTGRKLRSAYSTKEDESRHFELTEGTFDDSIVSVFNREVEELHIEIPEKPAAKEFVSCSTDADEINMFIEAGFFKNLAVAYKDWSKMGFAIFNTLGNAGLPLFHKFSKLSPSSYDADAVDTFWESITRRNDGKCTIGSIKYWAKQENPEEYERLKKRKEIVKMFITVPDVEDPFNCATIIKNTLKTCLIRCKEEWFMLTDNNLWKKQQEPTFYIVNEIRKYIDYSNLENTKRIASTSGEEKDKLIEIGKAYLKLYKFINGSSYLSVITKHLKTYLVDDNFADKLDSNMGVLAFKNGLVDLQTGKFREGILSSDFLTETIPHDYSASSKVAKDYVKSVLLKILNNNEKHLEYFLSVIGYTFIGKANLEKSIYFCIDKSIEGKGDNGKSFFFEILTVLMPNYVCKTKSNILEDGNAKVHKQLVGLKGKRLVWIDEYGKKKTNAELLKSIGDGTQIENEVMFGTTQIIKVFFKMFILSNHIPNIDPNETAVYNRYKQISFGSHFDRTGKRKVENASKLEFIADPTLMETLIREHANSIFGLIIDYAGSYYSRKLPEIPSQFLEDTRETQLGNDDFAEWFEENMEIGDEYRVACKHLAYMTGKDEKTIRDGMKRMGFKYDKDLSKIGKDTSGKSYKGGFIGCRLLEIEETLNEDL